ncbi:amidophosphoribosyltransferase [Sphingomonas psychrolutea]|uniref:Amidophosphoribosyltransferase n=1 Tax=Sphingomonas psychrolutea TaxID=1259676 RepID=A0ABQ1G8H7_9SPHN|nr:amidophosphoribosyltransferase [Sphingomonas psychrolutea]
MPLRRARDKGDVSLWLAPLRYIADFALPPRCPGCGAVTGEDHRFCATCWGSLRFLGPPWCAGCNVPFDYDRGADARCAECLADPPRHAGIRAAVAYGEVARTVVVRLKYGGRTAFAETVGRQMARLMPQAADLLVPVPLHRWRIWSRGFNQSALIAAALTRATGVPNDPLLLRRIKPTPPLRGMGAKARARAVAGVFRVVDPEALLKGKSVVLIDDVHTSGATTDGCVRVLLRAGAARVTILCWTRVLEREDGAGN